MRSKFEPLTPQERLKYECARELGLIQRLEEVGGAGLTAKESGRIGGKMGRRLREG